MAALTLEERVAALEAAMEQLKQQRELDKSDDAIPWWKKMVGIYQDNPEFEEAVRAGRKWREDQELLGHEDEA